MATLDIDPDLVRELFGDILLNCTCELGRTKSSIGTILNWKEGDLVHIDKTSGEPVDCLINGKPIASGEVMVVDDRFSLRITDISDDEKLTIKSKYGLYSW